MSRAYRPGFGHFSLAIGGMLSFLSPVSGNAETFSSLPPPPGAQSSPQQAENQQYMLGLEVNQREIDRVVPVTFRDGHYLLHAADLIYAGIDKSHLPAAEVDVSAMPDVKAVYDSQRQRISLTVPLTWLPKQTFQQSDSNGPRYPGRSSNGALLNYDAYTSRTSNSGSRLAVWNELRLFGGWGQFASNGTWQQQLDGPSSNQQEGYLRYDTWWANEDENHSLSWRVGDLITDSLSWSNSVRLGGIQIARDFSVRPDLVTYPLPSFSGQAAVPSTVDLFINGYRSSTNQVQPGPWALTNMPFVNGAGDAVVVTTDAVGRRVTTTMPFYVSSDLLKEGLSDYSASAGALRQNYGLKSFDYGTAAASGSYRYGLTNWLTLEGHAEAADKVALGGAGATLRVGAFGVVNGAIAHSQMEGEQGTQYSWGYQYSNQRFSVGTQQTLRTATFGNLALYGDRQSAPGSDTSIYSLSRRSAQYNASLALDRYGNLGAAYIDISNVSGDRTKLLNLSWSKNLWGNSSLYVSATRDQTEGSWTGTVSMVIPFSDLGNASISVDRDREGRSSQRVSVSRAMPSDGGFSWDASWANRSTGGDYRQASLGWRNNKFDVSGGYYGDSQNNTTWGDMSGSVVLMDGSLFAANEVNDAFVLVKTNYPDVGVRYENQLQGKTDKQGYLLVPRVGSYYPAKYDIDTLDLPANMTTSSVEQRFSVKRQSGYLLNFPIEPLRAASVILHDQQGKPLPVSSQVYRDGQQPEFVGWDGIVWLENLSEHNPMRIVTPDGQGCTAEFTLTGGQPKSLRTYGPITCELSAPSSGTPP